MGMFLGQKEKKFKAGEVDNILKWAKPDEIYK